MYSSIAFVMPNTAPQNLSPRAAVSPQANVAAIGIEMKMEANPK